MPGSVASSNRISSLFLVFGWVHVFYPRLLRLSMKKLSILQGTFLTLSTGSRLRGLGLTSVGF